MFPTRNPQDHYPYSVHKHDYRHKKYEDLSQIKREKEENSDAHMGLRSLLANNKEISYALMG